MNLVHAIGLGASLFLSFLLCACSIPSMVPRLGITAFVGRSQAGRQLGDTSRGGTADDTSVSVVAAWEEPTSVAIDPSVAAPEDPDVDQPACASPEICAWADTEVLQTSMELEP